MRARSQLLLAAAAAIAALPACTRNNPLYCERAEDCQPGWDCDTLKRECIRDEHDAGWNGEGCADSTRCPAETPVCNADHMCEACAPGATGDADCTARDDTLPICRDDGRCVACLDDDGCTDPLTDFCDQASGVCRGCIAHDECASEVCNIGGGTCLTAGEIIYVDSGSGADGTSCGGQTSPCATIGGPDGALAKVAAGRRTVRIRTGTGYPEALDLDGISVVLVGPGAVLQPVVANSAAVVAHNAASVTIDGLQVTGADGATVGDGVRCSDAGTVVRIDRATVSDNDDVGIEVEAGCELRMSRTVVARNLAGGVRIASDSFDLGNSFLVDNGDGAAAFGGLRINQSGDTTTRRLAFLTVAGNTSGTGASGIQCTGIGVAVGSSIVWGNSGGAEVAALCSPTYSDVEGGATGDGNVDADPLFVGGGNYHITSGSPCIDAADPGATALVDIDGDLRPAGAGRDIGADEVE